MRESVLEIYNAVIEDYKQLSSQFEVKIRNEVKARMKSDPGALFRYVWKEIGRLDKLFASESLLAAMVKKLNKYSEEELKSLKVVTEMNMERHRGIVKNNVIVKVSPFVLGAIALMEGVGKITGWDIVGGLKDEDGKPLVMLFLFYLVFFLLFYAVVYFKAAGSRKDAELLDECVRIAIANKQIEPQSKDTIAALPRSYDEIAG